MDPELVVRARQGDHDAFARLVAGSIGRLNAIARLILRDYALAEDAVQDCFVDAWRSLPGLRDPERFQAWLTRLLVRSCQDARRRARRRTVELPLLPSDGPDVPDHQARFAVIDQIERGLQRLTVDERAVLVLTYYLDLPVAETASVLGIPSGTVKSRLHRAISALRATVDADDSTGRHDRGANDMTAHRDVDLFLRAHFDATADPSVVDGQIDAVLTRTAGARQQPAWLAVLRSHPMTTTARSLGRPMSPAWALLIILALLIAITGVGITTGTLRLPAPPPVNGPIVFGRYVAAVDDTVIHIARPDGSEMRVLVPGPNECPRFSPDGRTLSLGFGTVNVDGTEKREFTNPLPNGNLGCSTWSPDGTRLAVEGFNDSDRSFNGIFLANASDGSDVVRLTTNGTGHNDIPGDFSPDGRQLAYLHGMSETTSTLWVVDIGSGDARQVVTTAVDYGPTWSPDGQWILIDAGDHFLVVRPNGEDGYDLRPPASVGWVGDPQYSPDGTRILFHMALKGSDKNDIYTMKVDGTDLVQITDTPNDNEYFTDWGVDPR